MSITHLFVGLVLILGCIRGAVACDESLPPQGARDDVLVIVNDNSEDSCAVAVHYAAARNLGRNNLAHIRVPANHWIRWPDFRLMLDQLLLRMQQPDLLKANAPQQPPPCDDTVGPHYSKYYCPAWADYLREWSKIRYLVTTRGVPAMVDLRYSELIPPAPIYSDTANPTSVDNHLAYWLIRYYPYAERFNYTDREVAFGDGRGMRTVDTAHDGELIVGRVDGLTRDAAIGMIERTMTAESEGLFGKIYTSRDDEGTVHNLFEMQWRDFSKNGVPLVYGAQPSVSLIDLRTRGTGWAYQFGIFGEQSAACADYTDSDFYMNKPWNAQDGAGLVPEDCVVSLNPPIPGKPNSRSPIADEALVYVIDQAGQSTGGGDTDITNGFNNVMNWVKDRNCSIKLCADHPDPDHCRSVSTDALKEINTECVGMADGFIGYNMQSYPMANMMQWPTGWRASWDLTRDAASPEIRTDISYDDDQHSMWFRNTEQRGDARCYVGHDLQTEAVTYQRDITLPPVQPCRIDQILEAGHFVDVPGGRTVDHSAPQTYRVRFAYRADNITREAPLYMKFTIMNNGARTRVYWEQVGTLSVGNTGWQVFESQPFTLNGANDRTAYNRVMVTLATQLDPGPSRSTYNSFAGDLGIDAFQLIDENTGQDIAINGGFTQGYHSVSAGDFAPMYLSRLNGVAFWGSVSHYSVNGGHRMGVHNTLETLIYFMRGLPLGDAVWWGESGNCGLFYGDPLYSPVAIHINYTENAYDFISGTFSVSGSAVNGRDKLTETTYQLDYCRGDDFFVCDRNDGSWITAAFTGDEGVVNGHLGDFDVSALPSGDYVLRLAVTRTRGAKTQTFNDYYPVKVYDDTSDYDEDGLSDQDELSRGTNPTATDTDNDTLSDYDEVHVYATDPTNPDTDGDGIRDDVAFSVDTDQDGIPNFWESRHGSDPQANDAFDDLDDDEVINIIEYLRGTDFGEPTDAPVLKTVYVDRANSTGVEDGLTAGTAFTRIADALVIAQHGDVVEIAAGNYPESLIFSKSLKFIGPADGSAVLTGGNFVMNSASWGGLENIVFRETFVYFSASRNVRLVNTTLMPSGISITSGSNIQCRNCLVTNPDHNTNAAFSVTSGSHLELLNATIAGFSQGINLVGNTVTVSLRNTILANADDLQGDLSGLQASYSLTNEADLTGEGNITGEPLFAGADDYHLLPGSPAIDAGAPEDDYSHEPVPNGCRVDMGAYGNTRHATPSSGQCGVTVWFDDELPQGATAGGNWDWSVMNPSPVSGTHVHRVGTGNGVHGYYFDGSSYRLVPAPGESLFAYVYLDPASMPEEIMLAWRDIGTGGSWHHRAYWGANKIRYGTDGTDALRYMGPLPAAGGWVRLEVPASAVGLEGRTITGMSFTLYGGSAVWDAAGKLPTTDTTWFDDALPAGTSTYGRWTSTWVTENPSPFSGTHAYKSSTDQGAHGDIFDGATDRLTLAVGESLFAYVYLDPASMPEEIMLAWRDIGTGGSWHHRAYWGANKLLYGTDSTDARRYMGPLPAAGRWVRLEVPASAVGLEGKTITGMSFTLYGGSAFFDYVGKSSRNVPAVPAGPGNIWLDDTLPPSAHAIGSAIWVSSSPAPYAGTQAWQVPVETGTHDVYFDGTSQTITFNGSEGLFVYVYLDPENPPQEIMFALRETGAGGGWHHRAYWGADLINYGTPGTSSRRYRGALPPAGSWQRLEIPASEVDLEGRTIGGMSITLFGGSATLDYVGKY